MGFKKNHTFESFQDFLDYLETTPPAWPDASCSSLRKAKDWSGNVTYAQAVNLAEFGWPEGRELISDVTCDMKPENVEVQQQMTTQIDVAGAYPIVALAVAGEPAHMVDIQQAETSHKIIRVVVSISNPARIDPEALIANGGAVVSYVAALEGAGWSCEIWTHFDTRTGGNLFRTQVCIKRAGDLLDLDRVGFCLAHPAMLRKLMFRMLETCRKAHDEYRFSYGAPATEKPDDAQVYVPTIPDSSYSDPDRALARVSECMDENLTAA